MLDVLINGINERFIQDSVHIISAIDKWIKLYIVCTDIIFLADYFQCITYDLTTEIQLLKIMWL